MRNDNLVDDKNKDLSLNPSEATFRAGDGLC
jgi:hypothetical protein